MPALGMPGVVVRESYWDGEEGYFSHSDNEAAQCTQICKSAITEFCSFSSLLAQEHMCTT